MNEDSLNKKSKDLLDEHAEHLDAATLSKLHQARNKALEKDKRNISIGAGWAGAGALAASLAVGVIYFDTQQVPTLPAIYEDPLQQAAAEEMELMDDLEFYAWLVLQEDEPYEDGEST